MIAPHSGLRAAAAAGLFLLTLAIILIASGQFDPQPAGSLTAEIALTPLTAAPETTTVHWLDTAVPRLPATVQLTAVFREGAADSSYGLVAGNEQAYFAAAVSPTGMVSVWEVMAGQTPALRAILPWQTWPHVRAGQAANEIWLTLDGNTAEVRINRELLWTGSITARPAGGRYGLIGTSHANEPAVFDFEALRLFTSAGDQDGQVPSQGTSGGGASPSTAARKSRSVGSW